MKFLTTQEAIAAIREGRLLVYPTETFYALGCDALNAEAVRLVYAAKKRSHELPLPVIIGSMEQLESVAAGVSGLAREVVERFWPGPLTVLLQAAAGVPEALSAGTGRVAVRLSPHAGAALLCRESGRVLVSSSANISGVAPVVSPERLDAELLHCIARDGGIFDYPPEPGGGLPSTIVEAVAGGLLVRRQGAVAIADLRRAGFRILRG